MTTIHVPPEFPLNRRMRKAVRRGKLEVVREGEHSSSGGGARDRVFIYWDNSNIFIGARGTAKSAKARGLPAAGGQVRINFSGLVSLALAGREGLAIPGRRPVMVAASTPPDNKALWESMEGHKEVHPLKKFDRRGRKKQNVPGKEQNVPDLQLQLHMMWDALDSLGAPGVAVLLSGDKHFIPSLERMRAVGWGVEVLAWKRGSDRVREWVRKAADENVVFIPLDGHFEAVTYEVSPPRARERRKDPGEWKVTRHSAELTEEALARRPKASPCPPGKR